MDRAWKVGDGAELTKAFSEAEVQMFAAISMDRNPLHLDEEFAAKSVFGARVVHGVCVANLFSGILGGSLPGPGTIYLAQSLSFKGPVYIGEKVTARVEITGIREDKPIVTLSTRCTNEKGDLVVDGEAVVKVP